jgi:hypothetical protein
MNLYFQSFAGGSSPGNQDGLKTSRPISRVLYGSGRPERGSHSSGTALARRLVQPTRMTGPETGWPGLPRAASSLFGLAPGGVYHAVPVARSAVGSYPTLSPLPRGRGGLLSVALSLRSPSPDIIRHRVSVEPGLSSPHRLSALVERGCPADWHGLLSGDGHGMPTKSPKTRPRP